MVDTVALAMNSKNLEEHTYGSTQTPEKSSKPVPYPLPHQSQGTVSSTRSEAATTVYAKLGLVDICVNRNMQPETTPHFIHATLTTDSQATVDAYEAQVLNFITAPKTSKSAIQDHMHNMKAIKEVLKTEYGTDTKLIHNHNEHGRNWNNEGRDDLPCRANQACDRAAKKIAAVIDQRFQNHGKGHGGIAFLAKNGSYITDDIKKIIADKRNQDLLKITQQDRAKQQPPEQLDEETIDIAHSLIDDEAICSIGRTTISRGTWTMQDMKQAAKQSKNGRTLKSILSACGKYNTMCPYCFNIDTGEGREDHPDHASQECTHKSAKAARESLKAKTSERQWREGPLG